MPWNQSQRKNLQKRILNQTLWVIPSKKTLMMTKTQMRNFNGLPREKPTRNSGCSVGIRNATRHFQQKLVLTDTGCTNLHSHTNWRNGIYTWDSHKNELAREYLGNHFPNWQRQLFTTKAKNFKSASGKMESIGTIIKEMIIPHSKGNIRLRPEFLVLEDTHIQVSLLGTDNQRIYGIDIYNSKNRHITVGKNKEKKFSIDIYKISTHDPLEELLNEFKEGQFSTNLTSKQKLSLLKILRKTTPEFSIGEKPLVKITGHEIELYLYVERPYSPMLRRPQYPEILETRKEIENN
ncbi:hypothetical protein O181_017593 [Austropuccinia psidii MF-1]|uniref:Uncharacterized protein n=1 Tax=Austropuccinia psidii MF-1 TaxID=1389203 RepID=A0A9Q3GRX7_9BASI|nr:hypothetical protein [Austropuccinia psidii MF-1]